LLLAYSILISPTLYTAIHKPTGISSAQVLRDVQLQFDPSALFAPWLTRERQRRHDESARQQKKRRGIKRQNPSIKIGHGGTLDPLATGVLIAGIGRGTKELSNFLSCTKSYETVVLFGAATDTYDRVGKVVGRKPYEHITEALVREKLDGFRGKIMQRPPIYSALKVQGKKLYEFAREGKEVPVEIKERPVEVVELEMVEWMEGGTHEHIWPEEEAPKEEKEVIEKVLDIEEETGSNTVKAEDEPPTTLMSGALANTRPQPKPPAARLRMTVTSGFYVRSLCHDLGAAVSSLALMSSLVRTRQGDFELGKNVLEYADLQKGEAVWGPKVEEMLGNWARQHDYARNEENWVVQARKEEENVRSGRRMRDRDDDDGDEEEDRGILGVPSRREAEAGEKRRRRNSSSVEP